MRRRRVLHTIVTVICIAGLQASADARRASDAIQQAESTRKEATREGMQPDLSSLISEPRTLSVVRCDLDNARWGGYATRIYLEKARDGKSYILNFSNGQLSTRPVTEKPAWVFWGSPEQQRDAKVVTASADEAFSRGIPFYVSAELQPPSALRVTVVSNPAKRVGRATLFTSWDNAKGAGRLKDSGHVRSASQPQTLVVKDDEFKDMTAINAWVREGEINKSNPFADMPHCLISNEIEVTGSAGSDGRE